MRGRDKAEVNRDAKGERERPTETSVLEGVRERRSVTDRYRMRDRNREPDRHTRTHAQIQR